MELHDEKSRLVNTTFEFESWVHIRYCTKLIVFFAPLFSTPFVDGREENAFVTVVHLVGRNVCFHDLEIDFVI